MTQEASSTARPTDRGATRRFFPCFVICSLVWSYTVSLLWFLETSDFMDRLSPDHLGAFFFGMCWSTLCPDWPFLAAGASLSLITYFLAPLCQGAVRASLIAGALPLGMVLVVFSFTTSSFLPALFVLTASFLSGAVASLFRYTGSPESAPPKREKKAKAVKRVVATLFITSIPFWLFSFLGEAWSGVWPAKITEAHPALSPDGAYVAVIHNVDPNVNDYSDVTIRPRHTFLDLFTGSSASTRLYGVDKIEWLDRRTLRISGDFHPRVDTWNDVRIVYNDTADPEERREREALRRDAESR